MVHLLVTSRSSISLIHRSGPQDDQNKLQNDSDLTLYDASDIKSSTALRFTSSDLIFIALLTGGDYNVRGCF